VTGNPNNQHWQTTLEFTRDDFATITTYILANTPAATPAFSGKRTRVSCCCRGWDWA
jgi:hypothetical protein